MTDPFVAGEETVSAMIRAYCRQTISLVTDDDVFLVGTPSRRLLLPEPPVVEVSAVALDGHTITDYRATRSGALWRDAGWGDASSEVEVTYSHGFDPVPLDIVAVCNMASTRLAANPDGLTRFEAGGEDHVSETYPGPWGFTIADLVVLNRYRRRSWS